jgi:predicted pyridoxine 5'-phosphate oxidase superfamily flavin-nucleotide-binding protein
MAQFFPALTPEHRDFIARQPVFFVATAAAGARINLSPKGLDCLRVLDDSTVAWLDLMGSGNETNAHLQVDGRITVMFCAFDRPALIFRLYGTARTVLPQDGEWADLAARFELLPGTRQIFVMTIEETQTSCGWGVPEMTLARERPTLVRFHAQRSPEELLAIMERRDRSIDGLPVRVATQIPRAPDQASVAASG